MFIGGRIQQPRVAFLNKIFNPGLGKPKIENVPPFAGAGGKALREPDPGALVWPSFAGVETGVLVDFTAGNWSKRLQVQRAICMLRAAHKTLVMQLPMRPFPLTAVLLAVVLSLPATAASICFAPHCDSDEGARGWGFEVGVAFITSSDIGELLFEGRSGRDSGPAGGEIYAFTLSRRLGEFRWDVGNRTYTPQLESSFTLEIVDENSRKPFFDFNATIGLRWVDFPWNDHVKTTFAMGLGLSYSEKVYLMDIAVHPGEDRSKLKFNWPIALTLALPGYEQHQVMIFIAHQSGGKIFDTGGVNSLGIGYRHEF